MTPPPSAAAGQVGDSSGGRRGRRPVRTELERLGFDVSAYREELLRRRGLLEKEPELVSGDGDAMTFGTGWRGRGLAPSRS